MDLKPCPFCGNEFPGTGINWYHGHWSIMCGYFDHRGKNSKYCYQVWGEFDTEKEAIEAWNRRLEA